ncbi:MAG: DUF1887 family protein [Lachnospiraceae bacterium]|nr:DUF1887 family protein [Lachnospiraceae bacterium]
MTLIEFFESSIVENICTSIAHAPDRVILIGEQNKLLQKHAKRYREFFLEHGYDIEFLWRSVDKNKVETIIKALEAIFEEYPDSIIDVTGGADLYLFSAGVFCERYRDRNVQVHYINIRSGATYDCDLDGEKIIENNPLQFSVDDNIRLYGGKIVYDDERPEGTHLWDLNEDFKRDIRAMWEICREDRGLWNWQMEVLGAAELFRDPSKGPLETVAPRSNVSTHMEHSGYNGYLFRFSLIKKLIGAGLILPSFEFDNSRPIRIEYKNEQVKRCLTKSGQILEMIVYLAACEAREKNGLPTYNDVMTGVFIDWDGDIHTEDSYHDAENEVDVILMRGMVPIFVSCKNGGVSVQELYKLQSVANKFGGKYAKKVLIAPALKGHENETALRERCRDMQIQIIDDIENWDETRLFNAIKTLWSSN